ncbi:helix-turn-helix domain-containing protein [Pseudobutyrivibrio sp.]|uniref:helix-turn-helix domain-containing protein n=1 Tax=Pseudobutyrivibrio sp. TaxID=2014367 RepID=UPI0025D2EB00|nr:helix-turn-helix transcriptional regulator [Pseudobutyrivibrio sp.]
MLDAKTIGNNIRYFRELRGETQKQLGEVIGLSDRAIGAYEAGTRRNEDILKRIAKHYNISFRLLTTVDYANNDTRINKDKVLFSENTNLDDIDNFLDATSYKVLSQKALMNHDINMAQHLLNNINFYTDDEEEFRDKSNKIIELLYEKMFDETFELEDRVAIAINVFNLIIDNETHRIESKDYLKFLKKSFEAGEVPNIEVKKLLTKVDEIEINDVSEDLVKIVMTCIYVIRLDNSKLDLAEFYNCYRYIYGLGRIKSDYAEQADMGLELLVDLAKYNNKYAAELIKIWKEILF